MKKFLIFLISFYQRRISVFKRRSCVFYPTCSEYARQALEKHGLMKGTILAIRRILRCHPWTKNHIDPVN